MATWAQRTPYGGALTEVKLVHPVITAHAARGAVSLHAMVNLDGATMPHGELALGVWGEGFIDRRHPHTWLHEAMVAVVVPAPGLSGLRLSLAAGKGFAPFGSDDPMSRPALRFPVNHHWSQIPERAVLIAGARGGLLALEGALFNGDEPERPGQWPNWSRFADSWSARVSVAPEQGLEFQASHARVASPDHRPGAGSEHVKSSASVRIDLPVGEARLYGLAEWAYNSELEGVFRYHSALVETEALAGGWRAWLRFERTGRPEEQRVVADPFRSVRPHLDNSILGQTRWTTLTAGAARALRGFRGVRLEPLLELTWADLGNLSGVVRPEDLFGRSQLWTASAGVRMRAGALLPRMGRYGVLEETGHRHQ